MASQEETPREIDEWARGDPLREWYAREVWGRPTEDDDALFEIMSLQVFQAGLNWHMILTKRDAFRSAFNGWRIDEVAAMGPEDVERLLQDPAIIRNRLKIQACISNARVVQELQREHGSFCNWFYRVLPGDDLSALQRDLRGRFKFMGPEIARMWLMASGRIPDN
ncbi:MAG: DNA-3-methyladenine glycosylase I [Chloroflexota bacterium]|nr:DNA-3-methyladenine glycosylase I [Chloroflexota bacterium]MDE2942471.1 DNA-3-methyladenine glycosylase I [Chloroflexota bacterium]MDE3267849.1 DNA-3-methyladenine glycosylase I [Chloroflexota bacterium]